MKVLIFLFVSLFVQVAQAKVVALDEKTGKAIQSGELFSVKGELAVLVDKANVRYRFSPYSVAEFSPEGELKLLRGSVLTETEAEKSMNTSSARIDFIGRILVSYDHKEKSTSAFVLEGQGRMLNPEEKDQTILMDKFRGASMVVGDVYPQMIRQLDFAAVSGWMKGYAWPKDEIASVLSELPVEKMAEQNTIPDHLKNTKIEDYFSSIESVDESMQPDYYDRKFDDPDKVIAEAKMQKTSNKILSPEEAALIALPSTKIDLQMDFPPHVISEKQKRKELLKMAVHSAPSPSRGLASLVPVDSSNKVQQKKDDHIVRMPAKSEEEVAVQEVLGRLRNIDKSEAAPASARGPASIQPSMSIVIPDPVYDFSENF